MFVDLSYEELLMLSCSLHTLDVVYGLNESRQSLMCKIDGQLDIMNNAPFDQIYPGACRVISGDN